MRTTVTLDPDVAAAVERMRRERGLGLSSAVNELARHGLHRRAETTRFTQEASPMQAKIDVRNVAEALEVLEGPSAR